jgi:tRNA dimethylallyltransferase
MRTVPDGRGTVAEQGRLLVALYGPTSSGKTRLSVELAERARKAMGRDMVIISADSRQVYRYLDIGTSKTRADEMHGIPHEMISVTEPVRKFELEDYVTLARRHIEAAWTDGKVPFVVGGTGIYVKALLEGWDVASSGANRDALRRDFPRGMTSDAYAMLRRLDRGTAARVHPNNYEAIINALATATAPQSDRAPAAPRTVVLGLNPPQQLLDERVEQTFDRQVGRGLFDEILALNARYDLDQEMRAALRQGRDSQNQVLHTHGYREYYEVAVRRGKPVARLTDADRAEVRTQVLEHIRGYTRRQLTFLRKLPHIRHVRTAAEAMAVWSKGRPRDR